MTAKAVENIQAAVDAAIADSGKTGRRKKIAAVPSPGHDTAACRVYGCLQCKAAKEGQ
jgi:hypothetical protein